MKIAYTDQATKRMASIAIRQDDVQKVIEAAEKTGLKAVSKDGLSLAKLVVGNVTIYAKYKGDKNTGVTVDEVYSHRVKLLEKE